MSSTNPMARRFRMRMVASRRCPGSAQNRFPLAASSANAVELSLTPRVSPRSAATGSVRESMNQHVMRAERHQDFGLTLTDAKPLSGIPQLWRFAALVATLLMGALAFIGGLYLGRSILLPVVAGLIIG